MQASTAGGKLLSAVGMLAIGDAIAFTVSPRDHVEVWSYRSAPRWYRRMSAAAVARPRRALAIAGLELLIGLGLAMAAQQLVRRLA